MGEITIILVLALIFIGPKKLPELASGLGKLIREIRKTTSDVKNEIQLDDAIRKPFEELRDAVTLHPDELKRRDRLRRDIEDLRKKMEADAAAMAANASQSPEEAPLPEGGQALVEGEPTDVSAQSADGTPSAESSPGVPTGFFHDSASHDHHDGHDHSEGHDHHAGGEMPASPAAVPPAVPSVPGTAPAGTVSRPPSSPHAAPPAPPLAAVLAKGPGSGPVTLPERRVVQPPSGSDFVRSLRAASEAKRSSPTNPGHLAPDPSSAADRGNTTQALTEADLAAITVAPPPPPPGQSATRNLPPSTPPRLPGATPRKNPT